MAARRGKSQATRNSNQATPAWVWLILGLLIGLAIYFVLPGLGKKDGDGFFRPQPNPDAQPAPVDSADVDAVVPETQTTESPAVTAPTGDNAPKETQYDFYTLLPGKEVRMSDAELAASAREEEARRARAALAGQSPVAAPTPLPDTVSTQPAPIVETPAATPTRPPAVATSTPPPPAQPASTATATAVASADSGARYILQAGAFGASGDAEATKARIALLGLSARVESAQIGGKTVYRVRMGPYGTASELAEAKQKLANSGLPAMAIKAQ
ncbi:SPOR domain-containing protein [Pseudoxanthomonas putridarboris]|uniref:SPOR domain-containing protein n=1 Tax=Pseudoxanthomonas putridarboris TaxID=752605 RepID=A0ABU9IW19_9GAMM